MQNAPATPSVQKPASLEAAISSWDKDRSVEKFKIVVLNWKNLTAEIARELYLARECLRYGRSAKGDDDLYTWSMYCDDIGLTYAQANSWLKSFVPAELSPTGQDVLLERKTSNEDERLAQIRRIAQYRESGIKPDDWTDADTRELRRQELENNAMANAESMASGWLKNYKAEIKPRKDYFADMLSRSKDARKFKLPTKADMANQSRAFDTVAAYLLSFQDIDTRANAALNLAYHLKVVINDLMERTVQQHQADGDESGSEYQIVGGGTL